MLLGLVLYITFVNVTAFAAFAVDKQRSRLGLYRIPEQTLLNLALIGGTPGALLARKVMRHKTRKEPFRTRLFLIAFAQVAILSALVVPQVRDVIGEAILTAAR